ncbi:DUF6377 domain-containing protein [Flammeovirga sp. SJP92]|uniref:DUF6377 domain-containing protein n=1 Tax=Flammeovirga sp. SJP92 TaxID=1775430 RepID=UPI000786FEF4|nr:DUF6377 domain-containing protein [Flammeovirga sp. SJP92]KXX70856.1 hypothetical protein AVL50_11485 [Flammeovirga sp. SJP92]
MIKFFTPLLLLLIVSFNSLGNNELDSLYKELDAVIAQRPQLEIQKNKDIDKFRYVLESDTTALREKYFLAMEIFKLYEVFEFYGALHFINEAIKFSKELDEIKLINESHINLASLLTRAGIYLESEEILSSIDKSTLNNSQLIFYNLVFKELYYQLSFYTRVRHLKEEYQKKYQEYCKILLEILPENSDEYLEIKEIQALDGMDITEARRINALRFSRTQLGRREYSKITFLHSITYAFEKDLDNQKKYLALSAISDLKGSIKDNASLSILASELYKNGDIERAYKYINISYEDAKFYNSDLRKIQIADILPLISKSYEDRLVEQKSSLQVFIIVTSFLSIILIIATFFIWRQVKSIQKARNKSVEVNEQLKNSNSELITANDQLKKLHSDLSKTNHVKEVYIGEFLKICSDYIDKLESQAMHTQKMLIGRKYGLLLDEIKNQDIRKVEMKQFYKNFDETFLNIYPDFVKEVNKLLDPSDPIKLKAKDLLNTELRIFALVRLGISDSAKISKLLGNSVTTIYNYRVKIKNKAIVDRDRLEDYVMKIGE